MTCLGKYDEKKGVAGDQRERRAMMNEGGIEGGNGQGEGTEGCGHVGFGFRTPSSTFSPLFCSPLSIFFRLMLRPKFVLKGREKGKKEGERKRGVGGGQW